MALTKLLIEDKDYAAVLDMPAPGDLVPTKPRCEQREARAWCAFQLGRYRVARAELNNVLADAASTGLMGREMHGRLTNNLGMCYVQLGNRDHAETMFTKSIEVASDLASAPFMNLGRLYYFAERFEDCRRIASECVSRFASEADPWVLLGVAEYWLSDYGAAVADLRTACSRTDSSAAAFAGLGTVLADGIGDFASAAECLTEARSRWPNDVIVANNLAYVHLMQGDVGAAAAILGGSVTDDPYLLATNGLLSMMRGELDKGRQGYEEAERVALKKGSRVVARMARQKMHLELGRAYERAGQVPEAVRETLSGLKVSGGNTAYHRELGAMWTRLSEDGGTA